MMRCVYSNQTECKNKLPYIGNVGNTWLNCQVDISYFAKFLSTKMLRATLDEGPKSNEIEQSYGIRVINWTHDLSRWGSQTKKMANWRKTYMAPSSKENQLVQSKEKKRATKGELMMWRTKMQVRVQGRVQFKDSICFKWSPNWFAWNLNSGPHLKLAWVY